MVKNIVLSDLVRKNSWAHFEFYREGKLFYSLQAGNFKYRIPVPIEDSGSGYFNATMKTVELMRWIRKAIESEEIYYEESIIVSKQEEYPEPTISVSEADKIQQARRDSIPEYRHWRHRTSTKKAP